MDRVDREQLTVEKKLELLAHEAQQQYGYDPRGGACCFVGRPRVLLQLLVDAPDGLIRLERPVIIGTTDADVVGRWREVSCRIRTSTVGNNLVCIPLAQLPPSNHWDRRLAGALRVEAWKAINANRKLTVDDATLVLP